MTQFVSDKKSIYEMPMCEVIECQEEMHILTVSNKSLDNEDDPMF